MSLPYENTTSGKNAMGEIQRILQAFGCTKFGFMEDVAEESILCQFEYRGRQVSVKASAKGYAAAWLRENPWNTQRRSTERQHHEKAMRIGRVAVYSILRDWIKGQITAVECGILSFEGAFLGSIMLPSGQTVLDHIKSKNLLEDKSDG